MFQHIDMGKIAEMVGKITASADFSKLQNTKINMADIYYKIVQNNKDNLSEINIKIKINPMDENIENKLLEILKIITALGDAQKMRLHKVV